MDPTQLLLALWLAGYSTSPLAADNNYIVALRAAAKPLITAILVGQQKVDPTFLKGFDPKQFETALFTQQP
jgi:hypothetical protein